MRNSVADGARRVEQVNVRTFYQTIATIICLPLIFALWSAWEAFNAGEMVAATLCSVVALAATALAIYLFLPGAKDASLRR